MSSGVGIDLLEIDRLERALERHPRLAERVFTQAERDYARERARPARHLAARFAAKEAVVKALGLSGGFGLAQIEVVAGVADLQCGHVASVPYDVPERDFNSDGSIGT